jgi:hypothetical protein
MKYIIKNILKEDYVNKKKSQEYLDFIVNEMLNGVKIKKDYPPNPTFNTITEFVDLYGNEELNEAMSNPENFNRLGWEEIDYGDGWSYFRTDEPKDEYDSDEFSYEFGYDWLQHLVDDGELRILTINWGGWEVVHQDLVMDLIVNNVIIRQTPLHRVFSKHKYTNPIPRLNKVYNRIMEQIIEIYKISKEEFELVFTKFKSKLDNLIKDKWGIEVVEREDALSNSYVNESIVDDFIEFGKEELSLGDGFNVRLTDDNDELETLASYDMSDNEISVLKKNRAIPDIIRSIAHEMVHHKQNELGDLKGNSEEGEDGSPWEDQANSKAGELVRMFGRENPEIYDL